MAQYSTEQVAELIENSDIETDSESELEEDPAFPLPNAESDDDDFNSPPPPPPPPGRVQRGA